MFKKIKNFIAIIIVATFIMPQSILAYSNYIVAGGENIGLQINNDGIIIAGFYKVNDIYPGMKANLNKGDTIIKVDDNSVKTIDDFITSIKKKNSKNLKQGYRKN